MAMAVDYVRIVYRNSSVNIDVDGKIRTYSDIAESAAVKHLGMTLLEAHVPGSALSLRGPVAAASKAVALSALVLVGGLELSDEIDHAQVTAGAWFLLEIDLAFSASSGGETLRK